MLWDHPHGLGIVGDSNCPTLHLVFLFITWVCCSHNCPAVETRSPRASLHPKLEPGVCCYYYYFWNNLSPSSSPLVSMSCCALRCLHSSTLQPDSIGLLIWAPAHNDGQLNMGNHTDDIQSLAPQSHASLRSVFFLCFWLAWKVQEQSSQNQHCTQLCICALPSLLQYKPYF